MKMRELDHNRQPIPGKPAVDINFNPVAGTQSFSNREQIQDHMAKVVGNIGREAQSGAPRKPTSQPGPVPQASQAPMAALPASNQFSINGNAEGIVISVPWFMVNDDPTMFQAYWDGLGNMVYSSKPRAEPVFVDIEEETTEEMDLSG